MLSSYPSKLQRKGSEAAVWGLQRSALTCYACMHAPSLTGAHSTNSRRFQKESSRRNSVRSFLSDPVLVAVNIANFV
jgi:hypothetical protein